MSHAHRYLLLSQNLHRKGDIDNNNDYNDDTNVSDDNDEDNENEHNCCYLQTLHHHDQDNDF